MVINFLLIFTGLVLFSSMSCAEIYQWVDSQGRTQFSDSPIEDYNSAAYTRAAKIDPVTKASNSQNLEEIANDLKKNRLQREKLRKQQVKAWSKKNKKRKQALAAVNKRKEACNKAKKKEDLAFRQRTQRQDLNKMRKALANYEKRQKIRREKCK